MHKDVTEANCGHWCRHEHAQRTSDEQRGSLCWCNVTGTDDKNVGARVSSVPSKTATNPRAKMQPRRLAYHHKIRAECERLHRDLQVPAQLQKSETAKRLATSSPAQPKRVERLRPKRWEIPARPQQQLHRRASCTGAAALERRLAATEQRQRQCWQRQHRRTVRLQSPKRPEILMMCHSAAP